VSDEHEFEQATLEQWQAEFDAEAAAASR